MKEQAKTIRIVFSTPFQDAGEALRALEIAGGIREHTPAGWDTEITFLSHGSIFEKTAADLGFSVYQCQPKLGGLHLHQDLRTRPGEFVGERDLAVELLRGEILALSALRPDLVVHGYWPFAGIARRMTDKAIPGISFLPVPLYHGFMDILNDLPEEMQPLSRLPKAVRRLLFRAIPAGLKLKTRLLQHRNMQYAAQACGWKGPRLNNVFDMLQADVTLVTDMTEFYNGHIFPESVRVIGPIPVSFPGDPTNDPNILHVFDPALRRPRIFCTMGSSGGKSWLIEAIRALARESDTLWNSVVLAPRSVCTLEEARDIAPSCPGIYITDAFVPAALINTMADLLVGHGGQGTLQTAIASGTPVVGFAMHPEQQVNLEHVDEKGAGIRIPRHKWKASYIHSVIKKVINNSEYRENAQRLKKSFHSANGKKTAALEIWDFITKNFQKRILVKC